MTGTPEPIVTAEDVQRSRLAGVPALYKTAHEQLACDLALDLENEDELFKRYGLSPEDAAILLATPAFTALQQRVSKELFDSGLSYRTKTRAMAEVLLPHVFEIATDPTAPTSERVKIFQWVAKMGGLEPKEKETGAGAGGFTLNIAFAGEAPQKVVTSELLTIEQQ